MRMVSKLLQAWRLAAMDLGISVRAHGDGVIVDDFGRANGTLCWLLEADVQCQEQLRHHAKRLGMGSSALNAVYARYDRHEYIDMLNDWGWTGDGRAPAWYTGQPWTE
jgi:hypothetical protein